MPISNFEITILRLYLQAELEEFDEQFSALSFDEVFQPPPSTAAGGSRHSQHTSASGSVAAAADIPQSLPRHHRCAAHTLNLIASSDLTKIIEALPDDLALRNAQQPPHSFHLSMSDIHLNDALASARCLWNKFSRSPRFAQIYKRVMGKASISIPGATRWNSYYDALNKLAEVFAEESTRLNFVASMNAEGFTDIVFTELDITWIQQYAKILRPIACALDKLQSDESGFLGHLIPEIVLLKLKLRKVARNNPNTCQALDFFTSAVVEHLIEAVDDRFRTILDDVHYQIATGFHPLFGLAWISAAVNGFTKDQAARLRNVIKSKMRAVLESLQTNENSPERLAITEIDSDEEMRRYFVNDDEDDDPNLGTPATATPSTLEVFLAPCEAKANTPDASTIAHRVRVWRAKTERKSIFPNQAYVDAFIMCNTGCPSSASVERLFSQGGDYMRAKRASMSNTVFEQVMFLRGNTRLSLDDYVADTTSSKLAEVLELEGGVPVLKEANAGETTLT